MPHCYQSADPLRRGNPMRQIPLYRSISSVFGASPRVRAEAELRIATESLASEMQAYAKERAALGEANRRPIATRRIWQARAFRTLNGRCGLIRAAQRRLEAAQAAVAALVPADDYATPWLAARAAAASQPVAQIAFA